MSFNTTITPDSFLLDIHSKIEDSEVKLMNTLAQIDREVADQLRGSITKLRSKKQLLEEQVEQLDEHIRKLEDTLGETPKSRIRLNDKKQNDGDIYTDLDRITAVRSAFEQVNRERFGRNEILQMVTTKKPNMFRDTKLGKEVFSNVFWRVVRDLIGQKRIVETERGGGRKATLFSKVNRTANKN